MGKYLCGCSLITNKLILRSVSTVVKLVQSAAVLTTDFRLADASFLANHDALSCLATVSNELTSTVRAFSTWSVVGVGVRVVWLGTVDNDVGKIIEINLDTENSSFLTTAHCEMTLTNVC